MAHKKLNLPVKTCPRCERPFTWRKKWDKVVEYDWDKPKFEWFKGAKLNITENCLDRHLKNRGDEKAIIWEPNDPNEANRILTYKELHAEVCKFSNVLKNKGVLIQI